MEDRVTIDDTEYLIDEMTEEQKTLVSIVSVNSTVANQLNQQAVQLNHQLACVSEIGRLKRLELKGLLESDTNLNIKSPEELEEVKVKTKKRKLTM